MLKLYFTIKYLHSEYVLLVIIDNCVPLYKCTSYDIVVFISCPSVTHIILGFTLQYIFFNILKIEIYQNRSRTEYQMAPMDYEDDETIHLLHLYIYIYIYI